MLAEKLQELSNSSLEKGSRHGGVGAIKQGEERASQSSRTTVVTRSKEHSFCAVHVNGAAQLKWQCVGRP